MFFGHVSVATTAQMYIHDEVDYHYLFSEEEMDIAWLEINSFPERDRIHEFFVSSLGRQATREWKGRCSDLSWSSFVAIGVKALNFA